MPVNVEWDNDDQTIIRADFVGDWSVDDAMEKRREMLDTVMQRQDEGGVNFIMDFTDSNKLPADAMLAMRKDMEDVAAGRLPEFTGYTAVVIRGPIVSMMLGVLKGLYPKNEAIQRTVVFKTLNEARKFLAQQR